mmetsp:Transcript_53105/g.137156  ORF Transcript_53105/g.137156 Transcript_53105/m.137156 type:complete len:658 (-) Transcript_53105:66-2039(-)
MASIFGPLDKRQRADAAKAATVDVDFEDRADLLNDLLEEDESYFPLLSCPPEVLSSILMLSTVKVAVRMRPLCRFMRSGIDEHSGFWSHVTIRDFADMGGLTKSYKGLKTLADAWDDSKAITRLEWDPLMICAPPALRYVLLATAAERRQRWSELGPALGTGWAWFSAKVCRRMAVSTFMRWASLQYDQAALEGLLGPLVRVAPNAQDAAASNEDEGAGGCSMRFRCGRQDEITLSPAAVSDIFETVQKWHNKAHTDMMRAHFKPDAPGAGPDGTAEPPAPSSFSVTPTLDASEAALTLLADQMEETSPKAQAGGRTPTGRGAASRHIEEAQLRLAIELSKTEAEEEAKPKEAAPQPAPELPKPPKVVKFEPTGLPFRAGGQSPALLIYLKDHCLAERVDSLPETFEKSVEHIVNKMTGPKSWAMLYESLTEELGFRAKSAAHALCASHARAVDDLLSSDISLGQERMCLPIWKSGVMTKLSKLRKTSCDPQLRQARCDLLKQAALEWCELEDLTEFLDSQLAPLELAIDNFRGTQEMSSQAHTPHVRDIGRLMFRNFCLLDSRIFRPLCLAAYALVHEVTSAEDNEQRCTRVEILESVHAMLAACDVADDHLSTSKNTKDAYVEHLVEPVSAAMDRLAEGDGQRRSGGSHAPVRCK